MGRFYSGWCLRVNLWIRFSSLKNGGTIEEQGRSQLRRKCQVSSHCNTKKCVQSVTDSVVARVQHRKRLSLCVASASIDSLRCSTYDDYLCGVLDIVAYLLQDYMAKQTQLFFEASGRVISISLKNAQNFQTSQPQLN